ncbi:protoporphyrinogen/coproporphyrinogen oxidase [Nocardia sp. CA-129566]|uniref:protoporphyrinogen/coproporphyrinogen oxidase n=1 Tax=Nocardia sp. CA-129566 TaxID=3239976 RepID=UPI003D9720E4
MRDGQHIAVVGAGISGLAAAYHLQQAGHRVELIEREPEPGGRCGACLLGDRPIMAGGRLIGRKYTALREFLTELGPFGLEPYPLRMSRIVDGALFTIDHRDRSGGLRHLIEAGAPAPDVAKFSYLAARAMTADGLLEPGYYARLAAHSDHKPLSEHFGPALTAILLRPMTVWTHGAEPEEVYLGSFGATLATVLDDFDRLTGGIQPVFDAVSRQVVLRTRATASRLLVRNGRVRGLVIAEKGAPPIEHRYDAVLVATPALAAADLVIDEFPAVGKLLSQIRYLPAAAAVVEYDRDIFAPDVWGITFDDGPCRAVGPESPSRRDIVRYIFAGRDARPLPSARSLETWLARTERTVLEHCAATGATRRHRVTRTWDTAYCAYLPDHGDFTAKLRHEITACTGLAVAGDYLIGTSLEACFRSGTSAADDLLAQLM